ncbi:uncharacterized protein C8R40DRAFT_372825 [Lentinula edodes]|uniref:uncharacterized protein n=1 Tax=Lentinula edodes TaxID=5353 RepID=UPI001E8DF460|nr:uncharacterized protein C8R40DRAFT_372825 [Lentinula edodes]KAH7873605.1 hypothetical protein C8R40DRAFT_372825 [Lentinula edodes]
MGRTYTAANPRHRSVSQYPQQKMQASSIPSNLSQEIVHTAFGECTVPTSNTKTSITDNRSTLVMTSCSSQWSLSRAITTECLKALQAARTRPSERPPMPICDCLALANALCCNT